MALFTVKVNETQVYRLMDWSPFNFKANPSLKLITADYQSVKNDFSNIEELEIYAGENLLATYTEFDTLSASSMFNSEFFEDENRFVDTIEITLVKSNLSERVDKLDKQINQVIDVDNMDLEDYRSYILSQVSKSAQEDVYAGDTITLSTGVSGKFSYKIEDQLNLTSSLYIIDKLLAMSEDISQIQLPYHSSGQSCQFYSPVDIVTIYFTLFMRSIKIQTYANAINVLIRQATTKEEISECTYGMELPEAIQENVNNIVATSMAVMQKLMAGYQLDNKEDSSKETETEE